MSLFGFRASALALGLAAALTGSTALASPVLIAGDGSEKVHSTMVSILRKGGTSVVSVMSDYQGNLTPFSLIIPVPADVKPEQVIGLKREFIDRLDNLSAPKFAEFWEKDPCEPGEAEQEWERDLTAKASTGFLGTFDTGGSQKVAKEMLMDMKAQEKTGEYVFSVLSAAELRAHLKKRDLVLPSGGDASIDEYEKAGYRFLVADVETGRVELVGGSRAQLSPIRFVTDSEYSTIPARFGLPSAAPAQELLIFTLTPEQRMQVKNYPTMAAPTNLSVDFEVKERMGEFYGALHDRFLEKNPGTFLLEYAFPSWDCGKPCPNEPLLPHELLSLGGDAVDAKLPESERRPAPPAETEEEQAKLKAMLEGKTAKEKKEIEKQWKADREELAARKALLARHRYIISRLHYRYGSAALPKDPTLGPGGTVEGGVKLPEGQLGAADPSVTPASANAFQTRYNHVHPDISVINCEQPVRYRWGKPPRTYRGLNKIWVAEDLSRKKRDKIKVDEVVQTPVPDLGIPGKGKAGNASGPIEAQTEHAATTKEGTCGCHAVGIKPERGGALALFGLLFAALGRVALRRARS